MYKIHTRITIEGAHKLNLNYESACCNLHGHRWQVDIYIVSEVLNDNGMVIDFTSIKKCIKDKLDHKVLNEVEPFNEINPTAENLAQVISDWVQDICNNEGNKPFCYRVDVWETENNQASWTVK